MTAFSSAFSTVMRRGVPTAMLALSLALGTSAMADPGSPNSYAQTNLVSNLPGVSATNQPPDPDLINAWGVAFNPNAFVWVADNGSGLATLYDGLGKKQGLIVTIPSANGTDKGTPTGITFNSSSDHSVPVRHRGWAHCRLAGRHRCGQSVPASGGDPDRGVQGDRHRR
jgi:hypothetical protein